MIQIFGTTKNFDTKKAQMWFKERRIPFQFVDLKEKEMSRGEFESVVESVSRAAGSRAEAVELLADKNSKDYASFAYIDDSDKEEKLFENQLLLKLPVCRNGKNAATCATLIEQGRTVERCLYSERKEHVRGFHLQHWSIVVAEPIIGALPQVCVRF